MRNDLTYLKEENRKDKLHFIIFTFFTAEMKFYKAVLLLSLVGFILACEEKNPPKKDNPDKPIEVVTEKSNDHSYSNTDQISTKHLHLDMDIDFETQTIYGVARHEMKNSGTKEAIFDIKNLSIQKVTLGKDEETETTYLIGENDSLLGQPLTVTIDSNTTFVNIYYQTTDKCEALDWLEPKMTSGKKHPFLYSQGQAILTRSWIPTQDSPSNRITYSADVKVPAELMAVMSANNPRELDSLGEYHFEMKQAIPCYLIALAVGDLRYKDLNENCGVYAEPELIEASASEFEDLPTMKLTAEKLFGEYQWEQYDVIVLPYSFPFGGMENPRLTFANPTLITGDKSLTSVIAHELAHSWSGNLVTNSGWDDFWLNEGFTVYIENRIMEELEGKEIADMLSLVEFQELESEMEYIKESEFPEDSKLKLSLLGRNPDEGMTTVAYIKGAYFLKTLENEVGRANFDIFLKRYFKHFAFKTISTEEFEKFLNDRLLHPMRIKFNTEEWLYVEGLPSNCVKIESERFKKVQEMVNKVVAGDDIFKPVRIKGKKKHVLVREDLITQEWLTFIRNLPDTLPVQTYNQLDAKLNFKNCGNSEIMFEWYLKNISAGNKAVYPSMKRFLTKVGRRKYVEPLFAELVKTEENKAWAQSTYRPIRENYHFVTRNTVDGILK
jgi:leukotriene-A4 hydrolase